MRELVLASVTRRIFAIPTYLHKSYQKCAYGRSRFNRSATAKNKIRKEILIMQPTCQALSPAGDATDGHNAMIVFVPVTDNSATQIFSPQYVTCVTWYKNTLSWLWPYIAIYQSLSPPPSTLRTSREWTEYEKPFEFPHINLIQEFVSHQIYIRCLSKQPYHSASPTSQGMHDARTLTIRCLSRAESNKTLTV